MSIITPVVVPNHVAESQSCGSGSADMEEERRKKRGRPMDGFVRQFYSYDGHLHKSSCLIDECGHTVLGDHKGNLQRHIYTSHPAQAAALVEENQRRQDEQTSTLTTSSDKHKPKRRKTKTSVDISLSATEVLDACVEIVTVNGRPFASIEDSGLRKILDPLLEALNRKSAGPPITINRPTLIEHITRTANELRSKIRAKIAGKLVSLKTDTVTRIDRQLIGVNVQFAQDGKLRLRNLGIKQFTCGHSAVEMKTEILSVIGKFGITASNVYSCTTDNARNITKSAEEIDKEIKSLANLISIQSKDCECFYVSALFDGYEEGSFSSVGSESKSPDSLSSKTSEEDSCSSEIENIYSESENSDTDDATVDAEDKRTNPQEKMRLSCHECTLINKVMREIGVSGVRCAAHTLQLAVEDALKSCTRYQTSISKARNLCKMLRIPTLAAELKSLGCNKILTEGETRWHILFDLLFGLWKAKPACSIIEEKIKTKRIKSPIIKKKFQNLSEDEWEDVRAVCDALEPARTATKIFQRQQLTVGDFYGAWLDCKLKTQREGNDLANNLVTAMERREIKLLSTPVFAAAIYLDPRYKILLTPAMNDIAESHLQGLWLRLHPLDNTQEIRQEPVEEEEETQDPVEQLMRNAAKQRKEAA